jgi:RNA polymerase sigma-70 factor (ECF subfamily)
MPDSDDFEILLTTHLNDMYALALQLTRSKENAEDLVQDLFISLSVKRYANREIRRPRAWLASILYRLFVDQWRRKVRSPVIFGLSDDTDGSFEPEIACHQPGPLQSLELDAQHARIQQALDRLNERQHQVLVLHDMEGYTLEEIADIMQVPLGTIKSNLHRGREKLHLQLYDGQDSTQTSNKVSAQNMISKDTLQ